MADCSRCGSPLEEGQAFCSMCGQPVGAEAAPVVTAAPIPASAPAPAPTPFSAPGSAQAATPTPPPYQVPPAPPAPPAQPAGQAPPPGYVPPAYPPAYGQGAAYPPGYYQQAQPPKKSRKGLWIGLGAAAVIIALACGLIFGVFKDQIFGGGASGPEQVVEQFLEALENKDADQFMDAISPESLESMLGELGDLGVAGDAVKEMVKAMLAEEVFSYGSMKFSDVKMETEMDGDDAAMVTITGGTATITEDGETETMDVTESDTPMEFHLVKSDGKWYIDFDSTF